MKFTIINIILVVLFATGCQEVKIPDISIGEFSSKDIKKAINFGEKVYDASKDITPEQEYYIGRSVAASILGKYKLYENNNHINNYVNSIGRVLIMNTNKPETFGDYHFAILDSDEINAFATPGGFIFITRGILKMCSNEDELAAVLAHEIAHVQLQHGIESIKDSRWTSVATMLGSEAVARHGPKEIATLTKAFEKSIDDVVNTLVVNGYSRAYENDADEYALGILIKSSYSSSAIKSMLAKMDNSLKNDKRGFGSTHPKASERIEFLNNLHKQSNGTPLNIRTKDA